ncbi:SWI/SNF-related matrix-associated actin-dependent regulator of chromatin subfamily D member 1 [Aphelenchoides fujianensis]|nr:SWI/SNF-related matrix-associated actin-dependent regulator of chromatin subfamily D member 1 [Aphelenchoides fujianensis]
MPPLSTPGQPQMRYQTNVGQAVHTQRRASPTDRTSSRRTESGGGFADRIVLPEVRQLVPEAEAYMSLLSFEQKLDRTLTRKRYDFQEALKRPMKIQRKLRIFVSHSFIPGREPEREGDEGAVPMWELRVEGRLIDDGAGALNGNPPSAGGTTPAAAHARNPLPKRKFSSFFKSLVIELDRDIYGPDNHLVEWHRTPQTNETDGFQVKRPGDRDVNCTILLLLDYQPMKFKLSPKLSKVLGIALETRSKIIEALWQYIKAHKLQASFLFLLLLFDAADRDVINCDAYLEQVFQKKRIRFMEIPRLLTHLLQQPDPLVLTHTIRYNGGEKSSCCYDIDVEMDDPIKQQMSSFIGHCQNMPDVSMLDQRVSVRARGADQRAKSRRDFYTSLAEDPHGFIQKWLVSQSRDLRTINEINTDTEAERRADYYHQPQIEEGVYRYIYGRIQQKRQELEVSLGLKPN